MGATIGGETAQQFYAAVSNESVKYMFKRDLFDACQSNTDVLGNDCEYINKAVHENSVAVGNVIDEFIAEIEPKLSQFKSKVWRGTDRSQVEAAIDQSRDKALTQLVAIDQSEDKSLRNLPQGFGKIHGDVEFIQTIANRAKQFVKDAWTIAFFGRDNPIEEESPDIVF